MQAALRAARFHIYSLETAVFGHFFDFRSPIPKLPPIRPLAVATNVSNLEALLTNQEMVFAGVSSGAF